jgi:cell division transport system permease protein
MFAALFRIIKFALQDFRRNFWLSFATVIILVLTLISINFLIILNVLTRTAVAQVQDKVDVSIYFKRDVSESQIGNIKSYLLGLSEVKDVEYISRDYALTAFENKHQDNPVILESLKEVGENPLGATLVIRANDPKDYPTILKVFDDPQYENIIQDKSFDDHEAVIKKIETISDKTRTTGAGFAGIFAAIAVLIGFNTVRMTIYTHREEIGIMKLVGAANWFVRSPYVVNGILYGLFAVIFTALITYPLIGFAEPYLSGFFDGSNFNLLGYFTDNFVKIFGLQFIGVVLLNMVTSSLAVGRYLKV